MSFLVEIIDERIIKKVRVLTISDKDRIYIKLRFGLKRCNEKNID